MPLPNRATQTICPCMTIRTIIEIPDPTLKQVSAPVETFDDDLKGLVADMFETMYDAPGIGLAAIQVGVAVRVLVIDLQPEDEDAEPEACTAHGGHEHSHQPLRKEPRVFINPAIIEASEELAVYTEGCLSVPEIYADVERPARIRARWYDLDGKLHEEDIDGMLATCLQHELDHLEGIVFLDRVSRLKRQMAIKKLEKQRKAA